MKSLLILLLIMAGVAFLACGYLDVDEEDKDTDFSQSVLHVLWRAFLGIFNLTYNVVLRYII